MKLEDTQLIKKWEELRLEAYLPTKNDVWTIGWGHTQGVKKGDHITEAQAESFFNTDVAWAVDAVNTLVKVPLTQNQFDVLVSFVFNVGAGNFKTSTLLKKLNAKDYQGAADQMLVWNKQKNKTTGKLEPLNGLTRRRTEEREYFLKDSMVEGPTSTSVDKPEDLKSLLQSKEVLAGAGAAITGAGSFLGGLDSGAQQILSVALSVTLVALGLFFIWNRVQARRNGVR